MGYNPNWSTGGGGGAPTTAPYVTTAADAGLSAERVTTDTAEVTFDTGTAGQLKANVGAIAESKVTNLVTDLAGKAASTHATSHKSGGSDLIKLDELAAPTDITTLNAATTQHGLLPKLPGGTDKLLRGDGTYGAKIIANCNSADVVANAADTYLAGSVLSIAGLIQQCSHFKWRFRMTKTGAGIAAPIWQVRLGTAGTTADTSRVTLTGVAQTGVIDDGWAELEVNIRTYSASGVISAALMFEHTLATTGLQNVQVKTLQGVSAAFDITAANLKIGISMNPGASGVWTFQLVSAQGFNLV